MKKTDINNKNVFDKVSKTKRTTNSDELGDGELFEVIPEDIKLVPNQTKRLLDDEELSEYKRHRATFFRWALREGKDPEKKMGYSKSTLKVHAYRLDRFYRYIWDKKDKYTTDITFEDVEEYINLLAETDDTRDHKSKCVQSLKLIFKWRSHELGEKNVDIDNPFSSGGSEGVKDYLSKEEVEEITNAAYEYGRLPTEEKTEDEVEKLRTYLSQRFGVSKEELSIDDYRSWKIPSLVKVSLEAGLRPCEVKKASEEWVDIDNMRLIIPKEDSAKNRDNWEVALTKETTETLRKWLSEREEKEKYNNTDVIWLTRYGNPYESSSLRRLLRRLFERAGISKKGRQASWYILRHTAGTHIYEEGGLNHVSEQLRHLGFDTSMRYVHSPISERRNSIKPMLGSSKESSKVGSQLNALKSKQSSVSRGL